MDMEFITASKLIKLLSNYIDKYGDLPIIVTMKDSPTVDYLSFISSAKITEKSTGYNANVIVLSNYNIS